MQDNKTLLVVVAIVASLALGYTAGLRSGGPEVVPSADKEDAQSMSDIMHGMNAGLEGKEGNTFDRAFLAEMIVHHEGAVDMAELALAHAGHQEIKDLAAAIIAAQEAEIASMRKWMTDWYGNAHN